MPVIDRNLSAHGVLFGNESPYGTATLTTADHGFSVFEPAPIEIAFVYDGARAGKSTGGYAELPRVAPKARSGSLTLKHYFRGPTAPYTSSAVISSLHAPLKAFGMSSTFDTDRWHYDVASSAYLSASVRSYFHGFRGDLTGAYVRSWECALDGYGPPVWTFEVVGMMGSALSDASVPAITYNVTGLSPSCAGMVASITNAGTAVSMRLRRGVWRGERAVVQQLDLPTATHPGFHLGMPTVTFEGTVEATTLVGATPYVDQANRRFDPDALFDEGATVKLLTTIGSAATGTFSLGSQTETMQFTAPARHGSEENTIATWDIAAKCHPADDASALDFRITTA